MRPLTEEESKAVFTKLSNYIVCLEFLIFIKSALSDISVTGQKPRSPY